MNNLMKLLRRLDKWAWSKVEPILMGESKAPASTRDDADKPK